MPALAFCAAWLALFYAVWASAAVVTEFVRWACGSRQRLIGAALVIALPVVAAMFG